MTRKVARPEPGGVAVLGRVEAEAGARRDLGEEVDLGGRYPTVAMAGHRGAMREERRADPHGTPERFSHLPPPRRSESLPRFDVTPGQVPDPRKELRRAGTADEEEAAVPGDGGADAQVPRTRALRPPTVHSVPHLYRLRAIAMPTAAEKRRAPA